MWNTVFILSLLQAAARSDGKINTCTASSVCSDSPFSLTSDTHTHTPPACVHIHTAIRRHVKLQYFCIKTMTMYNKSPQIHKLKNVWTFYSTFAETSQQCSWRKAPRHEFVWTEVSGSGNDLTYMLKGTANRTSRDHHYHSSHSASGTFREVQQTDKPLNHTTTTCCFKLK